MTHYLARHLYRDESNEKLYHCKLHQQSSPRKNEQTLEEKYHNKAREIPKNVALSNDTSLKSVKNVLDDSN